MGTTELIGGTAGTPVPKDAYLRIGFTERWEVQFDSGFASRFRAVHADLPTRASVFPTTPPNVVPGANTAVIDARNGRARTLGELVAEINDLGGLFVRVARVEILSERQRRESGDAAGVAARDKAAEEIARAAQDTGLFGKLSSLNTTARIIAAAILAWLFFAYVLPSLKGFQSWK